MSIMGPVIEDDPVFFDQSSFLQILRVEKMRTKRSKKPFLLLLLDVSRLIDPAHDMKLVDKVKEALNTSLREVDIRGWYHHTKTIGILFTEVASIDEASIDAITNKIYNRFRQRLNPKWINKIDISYFTP